MLHDIGLAALCISLVIYYIRMMNIFAASEVLGPKLVVIGRMVFPNIDGLCANFEIEY